MALHAPDVPGCVVCQEALKPHCTPNKKVESPCGWWVCVEDATCFQVRNKKWGTLTKVKNIG